MPMPLIFAETFCMNDGDDDIIQMHVNKATAYETPDHILLLNVVYKYLFRLEQLAK
jgi:hypothetical protein